MYKKENNDLHSRQDRNREGKGGNLTIFIWYRSEPIVDANSQRKLSTYECDRASTGDGGVDARRGRGWRASWQVGYVWTELTYEVGARPATILHEQLGPVRELPGGQVTPADQWTNRITYAT